MQSGYPNDAGLQSCRPPTAVIARLVPAIHERVPQRQT
jgi:hypothetical protein